LARHGNIRQRLAGSDEPHFRRSGPFIPRALVIQRAAVSRGGHKHRQVVLTVDDHLIEQRGHIVSRDTEIGILFGKMAVHTKLHLHTRALLAREIYAMPTGIEDTGPDAGVRRKSTSALVTFFIRESLPLLMDPWTRSSSFDQSVARIAAVSPTMSLLWIGSAEAMAF